MKKFLGILLAFVMLFTLSPNAFAASQTTLNFDLTCDGEHEVSKKAGDIITVTYAVTNTTDADADYSVSTMANRVFFDHTFFEYVDGSSKVTSGLNQSTKLSVFSSGNRYIYFNGYESPVIRYASDQVVGTFQLKIIATEGSSTIRSTSISATNADNTSYALTSTDLVVKIGNAPVTPVYELSFNTNGDSAVSSVKKESGAIIDLSIYTPVKSGFVFDGWYSDSTLKNKVTFVTLNKDTTVYAGWKKYETPLKQHVLTFVTNGGSFISQVTAKSNTLIDLANYVTVRSGYTFTGWYLDAGLNTRVYFINLTENTIVYAGWKTNGATPPDLPYAPSIPDDLNGTDHFAYIVGYDDGSVHPEANITRAEVATIFFRLLCEDVRKEYLTSTNRFLDVPTDTWYTTPVSTMAAMGILKGYDGYFRPSDPISRAEFAAIAARFADKMGGESVAFKDISGHWAAPEILKAASLGWVQGYDGYFRPNDAITRAESMTIINRILCRVPETESDLLPGMKVWVDNMDTSKWYYLAVQEATNTHTFAYKDATYETWVELIETPDWSKYQ